MKNFTLNQRDAEALISMLNAVQPNATLVQDLTQQFMAQVEVVAEEVPAEDIKEVTEEVAEEPAAVAAFMADEPHEQFTAEEDK
jgi:hypothetical protein